MIFEIFTTHQDENEALELMTHFETDAKHKLLGALKSALGESNFTTLRNIVKK